MKLILLSSVNINNRYCDAIVQNARAAAACGFALTAATSPGRKTFANLICRQIFGNKKMR